MAGGGTTPQAPANPQPLNFGGVDVRPDFDPIEILPPATADKLRMLRQRAADAHAIIPEFEEVRLASMARVEAANALNRLDALSGERCPLRDASRQPTARYKAGASCQERGVRRSGCTSLAS